ncbi:hypothetical protein OIM90_29700 [Streptomyces sp. AD16]|nr:hypothetical protein OIM90_29700 [Streptomyces sp. AD16]
MTTTRRKGPEAESRAETTGGCLSAALGGAAGLGSWAVAAPRRWPGEFETSPNWSVLYLDFPAMVLIGVALPSSPGRWPPAPPPPPPSAPAPSSSPPPSSSPRPSAGTPPPGRRRRSEPAAPRPPRAGREAGHRVGRGALFAGPAGGPGRA